MTKRLCQRCQKMVPDRGQHFCVKAAVPSPVKNTDPVKNDVNNAPIVVKNAKPVKNAKATPATSAARARKWREAHREESRRGSGEPKRRWRGQKRSESRNAKQNLPLQGDRSARAVSGAQTMMEHIRASNDATTVSRYRARF